MISELHLKTLDAAHREVLRRFAKLREARAGGDAHIIKHTEMEYYQALQQLYTAAQDAVADRNHPSR